MQPIYHFGGDGPVLHLAVANGFPPQTYLPLVTPWLDRYRVVNLPPRALWPSETPPAKRLNWRKLVARDLLDGIRDHDLRDIIAVGHSFGGVASLLAAAEAPERFRALVLLDPTIPPLPVMWFVRASRFLGLDDGFGLAPRAEKRRDHFESAEEAYTFFKSKRLFADWDDAALRQYAASMPPLPDGGVTLAWPRAWEAYYFRTVYTGTWAHLSALRGKMPVLAVRGGTSKTFMPGSAARMRRILPDMVCAEVPGHGHLFPQSAPQETHRIIDDWLKQVLG